VQRDGHVSRRSNTWERFGVAHAAQADTVVVGVNTVGIERMSEQQQDAFVEQLRQNHLKVVRVGIDEKYNHYIIRAYQQGIGVVAVVFPWLGSKALRFRPAAPSIGLIWGQATFSTIDPQAFQMWFSSRVAALEAGTSKSSEIGDPT